MFNSKLNTRKINRVVLTALLLVTTAPSLTYATNNFDTVPGGSSNISTSKLINYIDSKKRSAVGNTYCIGQDTISYQTMFSDAEKDYMLTSTYTIAGKNSKTNTQLSDSVKQPKKGTFKVKYSHNNKFYDNATAKSSLDGYWEDANMVYNNSTGKWDIVNVSGKEFVFTEPSDDKRGEWTVYVKAEDDTGNINFDQETVQAGAYSTKFKVHKEPVPRFKFTESSTHATLTNDNSYDLDYQYRKNSKKNLANDREYAGIKEFYWSAKIGDNWVDVGVGPTVTFAKNGQAVTDYRLTVEDYDGAYASIAKNSLILENPRVDFKYTVSNKDTMYFYSGNVTNEVMKIVPSIDWNDEAYNSAIYVTSGVRSATVSSAKLTTESRTSTSEVTASNNYSSAILNPKYTQLVSGGSINTLMKVKNKYDITEQIYKSIRNHIITGNTNMTSDIMVEGKFIPLTNATVEFNLTNSNVSHEDITVTMVGLGVNNKALTRVGTTNKYTLDLVLPDYSVTGNSASYNIEVRSKRDGSRILHRLTNTVQFIIPMKIDFVGTQYYVPGSKVNVDIKTNKYVDSVSVNMFLGKPYEKVISKATKYKDTGEDRYWTVEYVPPKDTPLTVHRIGATGSGIGGLTKYTEADFHYISSLNKVHHTPEWELNRKKYNLYKTEDENSPRTKDIFFNGERFMLQSELLTSKEDEFKLQGVNVSIPSIGESTSLYRETSKIFKGDIFEEGFKYKWQVPGVYELDFKFELVLQGMFNLIETQKIKVDSTDRYWRNHLKD